MQKIVWRDCVAFLPTTLENRYDTMDFDVSVVANLAVRVNPEG